MRKMKPKIKGKGDQMKQWEIKDYKNESVKWSEVPSLKIDEYPWYTEGLKQKTSVQIAISKDNIQILAKAEDKHIRARATKLMDAVYEDSCFEFFVTPWGERSESYFNLEVSCMGVIYMVCHNEGEEKVAITEEEAKQIIIESSLEGVEDITAETGWELNITLPISLLEDMSGKKIEKDVWHGNFYRCGGEVDDQYAVWNPLEFDKPNYHLPMQFGKLVIKE